MGKSKTIIGVCRLCGEVQQLCKSHIISNFLFKFFINRSGQLFQCYELGTDTIKQVHNLKGGPTERLLCRRCEAQLSRYESYACSFVQGKLNIKAQQVFQKAWILSGLSYSMLKLFFLSVVWRASISQLNLFKSIDLGPFERIFWFHLINADPGDELAFPVIIAGIEGDWRDLIIPEKHRIKRRICYRFLMGGFLWLVFVSKQKIPPGFEHMVLKSNGKALIGVEKPENAELITEYADRLRKKGYI